MVNTTDVWWNSNPTSAELSRHAADRSEVAQALRAGRRHRRIGLGRWFDTVRSARSARVGVQHLVDPS